MHLVFLFLSSTLFFHSTCARAAKLPAETIARLKADFVDSAAIPALAEKWESREAEKSARVCLLLEFLHHPDTLAALAARAQQEFLGERTPLKELVRSAETRKAAAELGRPDGAFAFYASLAKSARPDATRERVIEHWYRILRPGTKPDPKALSSWARRWGSLHHFLLTLAEWMETENYLGVKRASSPGAPGPFACPDSAFGLGTSRGYANSTLVAPLTSGTAKEARQLKELGKVGIDVALVAWREALRPERVLALVRARESLLEKHEPAPSLGLLYAFPPEGRKASAFPSAVRDFFSLLPPEHRALFDGRLLVFLADPPKDLEVSEKWGLALEERSPADFGVAPFLVKPRDRLVERLKATVSYPLLAKLITNDHDLRVPLANLISLGDFTDIYGTDRVTYAATIFRKVLDREAKPGALAGYRNVPNLFDIASGAIRSEEGTGVLAARWLKFFGGDLKPLVQLRNRPETRDWSSRILGGRRDLEVLADLLSSDFFYLANGRDPAAFVDDLYEKVLARCPTGAERKAALTRLQKDGERNKLVKEILFSDEAAQTCLARWAEFYLARGFGPASGVYDTGADRCPLFPEVGTLSLGDGKDGGKNYLLSWERALARQPRLPLVFLESASSLKQPILAELTAKYAARYHGH